jgi:hypothetical protein
LAQQQRKRGASWADIHNALFGIGGLCAELGAAERQTFAKSPEYQQIMQLLGDLPSSAAAPPLASGKVLVRLPKSLHAALLVEADAENTSLNQLIVSKLSAQLKAVVLPRRRNQKS